LEGLLEIVSLEMTMKSVGAGTHSKRWGEWVPNFIDSKYIAVKLVHSWWRSVVAIVGRRMNEVTLRRARLVLGWVTVSGRVYHQGM